MINKKHIIPLLLTLFVLVGFVLRILGFWEITFGYDQARDMMESMKIITSGDFIKIQGPMTDIPGLFHGSLYWYILAPFVYVAKGGPGLAKMVLIIINLSCIPLLYYIVNKMFKNKKVALLSALFFALSFEAVQYGRWMSNPSPALVSLLLSMYGLWLMTKKNIKGVLWFLLSWPFSIQFQFVLAYQTLFFLVLFLWNFRLKDLVKNLKLLTISVLGALVLVSPFIIGVIKYRFQSIGSLISHLAEREGGKGGVGSIVFKAWDYFFYSVNPFAKNIISIDENWNIYLFVIFLLLAAYAVWKNKKNRGTILFLIFWIFSPFIIFATGSLSAYFLTIGNLYGYLILASYLIYWTYERIAVRNVNLAYIVVLFLIVTIGISNIRLVLRDAWNGEPIFSVQDGNTYARLARVVDYTYEKMNGKPFGLNTASNPLFTNTTWAYIYGTYGKNKYGYLPSWVGVDSKGRFGDDVLTYKPKTTAGDDFFLIIEPSGGIPVEYMIGYQLYEDGRSKLESVKNYYDYQIEKRKFINEAGINFDDIVRSAQRNEVVWIRHSKPAEPEFEKKYSRYIKIYRGQ